MVVIPVNPAGIRTEPPPSVPRLSGPMPSATATALPPDEPPGVRERSHGLRVIPVSGESVTPFQPYSGVVVLPTSTAPCSRTRATAGASALVGASGSVVCEPRRVGQPRVISRSLIEVGTPSSAPIGSPRRHRSSDAAAAVTAPSASTRQNALTGGSAAAIRSSTARVASTGDTDRSRYPTSSSTAVRSASPLIPDLRRERRCGDQQGLWITVTSFSTGGQRRT